MQASMPSLRDLDLFHCPVTDITSYRDDVFKLLPGLKWLDSFDVDDNEKDEDGEEGDEDDDDEDDLLSSEVGEEDDDDGEEGDDDGEEGEDDFGEEDDEVDEEAAASAKRQRR